MADPRKVKPAKVESTDPLTEESLDQYEVLNGMGVLKPGQIQRLIEAARALQGSAPAPKPTPQPAPAPPPPQPTRCAHLEDTQRIPVQRRRPPPRQLPPRRPPPRRPPPVYQAPTPTPSSQGQFFLQAIFGLFVMMLGTPAIVFIAITVLGPIGNGNPGAVTAGVMVLDGTIFLIILSRAAARRNARQPTPRASPPPDWYDDDEEDEYDAHRRYIDQRWQGDNGLNGRVGWENNGRAS